MPSGRESSGSKEGLVPQGLILGPGECVRKLKLADGGMAAKMVNEMGGARLLRAL